VEGEFITRPPEPEKRLAMGRAQAKSQAVTHNGQHRRPGGDGGRGEGTRDGDESGPGTFEPAITVGLEAARQAS